MNRKLVNIAVVLGIIVCLFGGAFAALPVIPGGEQVDMTLTALIQHLTNGAKGGLPIFTGKDYVGVLAPGSNAQVLTYDGATDQPKWSTVAAFGISGGTATRVPFFSATDTLDEDPGFSFTRTTNTLTLGEVGSGGSGDLALKGNTSGTCTISPNATAGTVTWVPPTVNVTEPTALPGSITSLLQLSTAGVKTAVTASAIAGDVMTNSGASNVPTWAPAERPRFTNITQGLLAGDTVAATALTFTGEGSTTLTVTDQNRIGQVYHIIAAGGLTCDADGGEADVIDVRIGGVGGKSIAASTAIALGADTDAPWKFDLWLTIFTGGATATGYCTGSYDHTVAAGTVHKNIHTHITAGDALDLTATKQVVVVNDFAGTDAQDNVTLDMLYCTGNNQDTD